MQQNQPVIEGAIPDSGDAALRTAAYVALLKTHDWEFEYSSDHRAWSKGSEQRQVLRHERAIVDPDYALWNQHAPAAHRIGAPA